MLGGYKIEYIYNKTVARMFQPPFLSFFPFQN